MKTVAAVYDRRLAHSNLSGLMISALIERRYRLVFQKRDYRRGLELFAATKEFEFN